MHCYRAHDERDKKTRSEAIASFPARQDQHGVVLADVAVSGGEGTVAKKRGLSRVLIRD